MRPSNRTQLFQNFLRFNVVKKEKCSRKICHYVQKLVIYKKDLGAVSVWTCEGFPTVNHGCGLAVDQTQTPFLRPAIHETPPSYWFCTTYCKVPSCSSSISLRSPLSVPLLSPLQPPHRNIANSVKEAVDRRGELEQEKGGGIWEGEREWRAVDVWQDSERDERHLQSAFAICIANSLQRGSFTPKESNSK